MSGVTPLLSLYAFMSHTVKNICYPAFTIRHDVWHTEASLNKTQKWIKKDLCFWLISNLMHKILIYLHIIHLLKSSTCFEDYPAHHQEVHVVTVYMQPLVSSLSADDCPLHRLRNNFLNRCKGQSPAESDDTRGCIYTITTWTSWRWAG